MPEDAWDDDVVLEQAHADDDHGGEDGEVGRHGEADPHCKDPGEKWSDAGHDPPDAGEDADEEPVRQADRPETGREDGRNDDDENRLAAYESPPPNVDTALRRRSAPAEARSASTHHGRSCVSAGAGASRRNRRRADARGSSTPMPRTR